jgi:hypothetical protein
MPKVLRDFLGMVFFFWSNEQSGKRSEPIHIHICKGKPTSGATKLWLLSDGKVELCHNDSHLSEQELAKAIEYVRANYNNIVAEWYRHFGL